MHYHWMLKKIVQGNLIKKRETEDGDRSNVNLRVACVTFQRCGCLASVEMASFHASQDFPVPSINRFEANFAVNTSGPV